MSKMDISVERSITINCGNYSSIKPSVTLTLKDVDSKDAKDKYDKLSQVLDVLMMLETISLGNEMETVQQIGYKDYVRNLERVEGAVEEAKEILNTL